MSKARAGLYFPRDLHDGDEFYRAINPEAHLKPDGTLSSAAFFNSSNTNEMSVDWADRSTPAQTVGRFPNWPTEKCVASVTAGTYWDYDQSIKYSPNAHNQAHTSIVGAKTMSVRRGLARAAKMLFPGMRPPGPAG